MLHEPTQQLSFRLTESAVERVEKCLEHLQSLGLKITRADLVRVLIDHALDESGCNVNRLFSHTKKARAVPVPRRRTIRRGK